MRHEEEWRQIPWMPEGYMASSLGRIRRPELRLTFMRNGKVSSDVRKAKLLVGMKLSKKGYERINLGGLTRQVHRIIAELFVPNPENKPDVNHLNGIKTDNRCCNLEWVTNFENRRHAVANNLHAKGEACSKKLSEQSVLQIRKMLGSGVSQRAVAEQFGIAQQTVCKINRRLAWSHVNP